MSERKTLTYEGHAIKPRARRILLQLADGEPQTAGDLATDWLFDRNQIRYDLTEHLEPAGLVEVVGTQEMPGAARDARRWAATDDAQAWVEQRSEAFAALATPEDLADHLQQVQAKILTFEEELEDLRSEVKGVSGELGEQTMRLEQLDEEVDTLQENAGGDFDELEERIEDFDKRLAQTAEGQETLLEYVKDYINNVNILKSETEERFESLEEDVDDVQSEIQSINSTLLKIDSRIGDLEEDSDS